MSLLLSFLTGMLLCNAIPHLAAGLRGERFPTPFARPRGIGRSSPLANFLWGTVNLAVGCYLALEKVFSAGTRIPASWIALAAGFVLLGCFMSVHFGRLSKDPQR